MRGVVHGRINNIPKERTSEWLRSSCQICFVSPYNSLRVNEIRHPCIHKTQYPFSDPVQLTELSSRIAQHRVLPPSGSESTGLYVSCELTVNFCFLTKVSCSSTESGLMPITRRFDPLNTSFSSKSRVSVLDLVRKMRGHLPTSASLNWHASLVHP